MGEDIGARINHYPNTTLNHEIEIMSRRPAPAIDTNKVCKVGTEGESLRKTLPHLTRKMKRVTEGCRTRRTTKLGAILTLPVVTDVV